MSRKQTATATYRSPSALAETSARGLQRGAQSSPAPRDPTDCSPPGPSVRGILQARHRGGLPCPPPGDPPDPGIEPASPTLQAQSFPAEPPGTPAPKTVQLIRRQRGSQLSGAVPELRPLGGEQCSQVRAWALGTKHPGGSPYPATYRASRASVSPSVKRG